jgi:excisionase family DNA binding protein
VNGIYTAPEVAERLKLHINTVRRYIKEGKLKAFKYADNSRWRISSEELKKFIEERAK